ncbi:MAG: response regulator [Verrucomicrobiales bacterium]
MSTLAQPPTATDGPADTPSTGRSSCGLPILVADDDAGVCLLMEDTLRDAGFQVVSLHTGRAVLDWLSHNRAQLLLLDVRLPDMDGSNVLEALARKNASLPFIIISGLADTKVAVEYMRRGARDYLIKDAHFLDLVPTVVNRVLRELERDAKILSLQRDLLEISEREQRRIGQDIHDDLCQRLAALKMKLQHLAEDLEAAAPQQAVDARTISQHLGEATGVARALARGLSPVDIGHDGLPAALLGLVRSAEEIFQIECRLHIHGGCAPLDHQAATQLYRIAQEAIANAVKHAAAKRVDVILDCTRVPSTLTIVNDGTPFSRPPKQSGLGLHLMRQRAESIRAVLEFSDNPPGGTTAARVTLPIS